MDTVAGDAVTQLVSHAAELERRDESVARELETLADVAEWAGVLRARAAEVREALERLPGDLQDVFTFAYNSGWRKSEVLSLEWRDVDVEGEIIRLRADNSKNREPRLLPLSEPIRKVIARRWQLRTPTCPYVFHRYGGKPIKNFDGAWQRAREAAGCPEKLLHDCRRTAARALIRAAQEAVRFAARRGN